MSDEDWVQRALAASRPDDGLPADVAARLEARLADLQHERAAATTAVATSSPRRRPYARYLLAAAAVAAAVAVGVPTVRQLSQGPAGGGSSASSAAGSSASGTASSSDAAAPLATAVSPGPTDAQAEGSSREGLVAGAGVELTRADLPTDLARQRSQLVAATQAYAAGGSDVAASCAATPAAGTQGALVLLDGRRVLAEVSPASGERQAVRLRSCADGTTVARSAIPAAG